MPQKRWLSLIAVCFVIAPISFGVGHWSGALPHYQNSTQQNPAVEVGPRLKPSDQAKDYSGVLIENLGQVEFDQALDLLQSAPKEALAAWVKRLEDLPVGPCKTAGINAFFKALSQIDAATAVDLALSMKRRDPKWTAIGAISSAMPAANLNEVARMYTALNEKKLSLTDLVWNWSRSDPVATAKFLSNYSGQVDNEDIAHLMTNWAALDPVAAQAWLTEHPERREAGVCAGFYSGWVEHDRTTGLNDLRARVDDETYGKALDTVSRDLFKDSPDAARAFILTLPPAAQQAGVGAIVGDVTAVYLSGAGDLQTDEVAKWLITLPEELWRENLGDVMNRWEYRDRAGLEGWIDQLPSTTRDAVLADYCKAAGPYLQVENIRAGLKILDQKLREETLRHVFNETDPEGQEHFLTDTKLLPAEKEELVKILKAR
jgi:hypothetical protein